MSNFGRVIEHILVIFLNHEKLMKKFLRTATVKEQGGKKWRPCFISIYKEALPSLQSSTQFLFFFFFFWFLGTLPFNHSHGLRWIKWPFGEGIPVHSGPSYGLSDPGHLFQCLLQNKDEIFKLPIHSIAEPATYGCLPRWLACRRRAITPALQSQEER